MLFMSMSSLLSACQSNVDYICKPKQSDFRITAWPFSFWNIIQPNFNGSNTFETMKKRSETGVVRAHECRSWRQTRRHNMDFFFFLSFFHFGFL